MNKIRVLDNTSLLQISDEQLSLKDYIESIRENRDRLRLLVILQQLSSSLFLIFEMIVLVWLSGENFQVNYASIFGSVIFTILLLVFSIVFSILGIRVRSPLPVNTRGERLRNQLEIYNIEHRWSTLSLSCFLIAVSCVAASVIMIALTRWPNK